MDQPLETPRTVARQSYARALSLVVGNKAPALLDVCKQMDQSGSGIVNTREFLDQARALDIIFTEDNIRFMQNCYIEDTFRNYAPVSYFSYGQFFDELDLKDTKKQPVLLSQPVHVTTIKQLMLERLYRYRLHLKEEFAKLDTRKTGKLSYLEFRRVVSLLKIDLAENEFVSLFFHYDRTTSGRISYVDLCNDIERDTIALKQPVTRDSRMKSAEAVSIAERVGLRIMDILDVCFSMDVARTAAVSLQQFKEALLSCGVPALTPTETSFIAEGFTRDNKTDYRGFVHWALHTGAEAKTLAPLELRTLDTLNAVLAKIYEKDAATEAACASSDKDGTVSMPVFEDAVRHQGALEHFSPEEVEAILARFAGPDRSVRYKELLQMLTPPHFQSVSEAAFKEKLFGMQMTPRLPPVHDAQASMTEAATILLLGKVYEKRKVLYRVLAERDADHTEQCTLGVFRHVLWTLEIKLTATEMEYLISRFSPDTKKISYPDVCHFFVQRAASLAASL